MDHKIKYNPAIHHRRSIRLKGYDYSQDGLYFITICTHNREFLFGEIINQEMILNSAGKMTNECWLKIPEHFPDAILHNHVVMPNHVHGIIELASRHVVGVQNVGVQIVGVQNFEPQQQNQFQHIIPRSIGSIVRGYKIGVTNYFRTHTDVYQVWQRNYYERIIRDEQSYWRISEYIINNPGAWENDKFYDNPGRGSKF